MEFDLPIVSHSYDKKLQSNLQLFNISNHPRVHIRNNYPTSSPQGVQSGADTRHQYIFENQAHEAFTGGTFEWWESYHHYHARESTHAIILLPPRLRVREYS